MEFAIAKRASTYASGVPHIFKQGDLVLVSDYHAWQEKWITDVVEK